MSLLKSNSVQIGQSATATNNFTLSVPSSPDGTIKLARGNSGATTQDILSVNASGAVTITNGGAITLATAQASTSGTAIDFTGIPSWVKRITVMLNGVSTSGVSNIILRLGTSSGIAATGYISVMNALYSSIQVFQDSTGFPILIPAAADTHGGNVTISSFGSSNTWTVSGVVAASGPIAFTTSGYSPNLGGALDRIRLTMANGTDTFDAGSINIMYEG